MEELQKVLRGKNEETQAILDRNLTLEKVIKEKFAEINQSMEYLLQNLDDVPRERLQHLQTQLDFSWSKKRDILKNIQNLELELTIVTEDKLVLGTELMSNTRELVNNTKGQEIEDINTIGENNLKLLSEVQSGLTKWLQSDDDMLRLLRSLEKERNKLTKLFETILSELEMATHVDLDQVGRNI